MGIVFRLYNCCNTCHCAGKRFIELTLRNRFIAERDVIPFFVVWISNDIVFRVFDAASQNDQYFLEILKQKSGHIKVKFFTPENSDL